MHRLALIEHGIVANFNIVKLCRELGNADGGVDDGAEDFPILLHKGFRRLIES